MTTMQEIRMLPAAMVDIWKNFLFGPERKGRPKIGLFGLMAMASFFVVYTYFQSIHMGVVLNLFATIFVAFGWVFGLPAAIYMIDIKNRQNSSRVAKR